MKIRSRHIWLDSSKGLGILLLVILHVQSMSSGILSDGLVWFLKLFRMPMFFVVSGMLFKPYSFFELVDKKFRSLIVPYISYIFLLYALIYARKMVFSVPSEYLSFKGVIRLALGGEYLGSEYGVFWFIPCLFFTQILYNFLYKKFGFPNDLRMIACVLAIVIFAYVIWWVFPHISTPLALGVVPFSLPFMWFGSLIKVDHIVSRKQWLICAVVLCLAIAAGQFGANYNMDLKTAQPGVPILSLILAIALTWVFFQMMKLVASSAIIARPLVALGEASMTIMFMHQFIHFSLRAFGVKSDAMIIFTCIFLSYIVWIMFRKSPITSAFFLGTAKQHPSVKKFINEYISR